MRGLFQRGFERNMPAGLLESLGDEERQRLQSQYSRSALADIVGSLSGTNPGYSQRFMGTVPGLLEQSLAAQQAQRQQGLLEDFISATGDSLTPYQVAAIRANPKLIDQFVQSPTLSAGQAAFTPYGRMMAERAPTSVLEEQYQMGQMAQDPDYLANRSRLQAALGGPTVVGAGSGLFNQLTGEQIAAQPTPRMQELAAGVVPENESERQRKIQDYIRQGIPEYWATSLVNGSARMREFEDGRTAIVDMATGQAFYVNIDPQAGVPTQPGQPTPRFSGQAPGQIAPESPPLPQEIQLLTSVNPNVDARELTRVSGAAKRAINRVSDFMGLGAPFERAAQAEADLRQFKELTVLKLGDSVTEGRRSNLVLEMLNKVVPSTDSFFIGGDQLNNEFVSFQRGLDQLLQQAQEVVANETSYSSRAVSQAKEDIRIFNSIKADVDQIISGYGRRGRPDPRMTPGMSVGGNALDVPVTPRIVEPDRPAPEGIAPEIWRYMTPEERALWD